MVCLTPPINGRMYRHEKLTVAYLQFPDLGRMRLDQCLCIGPVRKDLSTPPYDKHRSGRQNFCEKFAFPPLTLSTIRTVLKLSAMVPFRKVLLLSGVLLLQLFLQRVKHHENNPFCHFLRRVRHAPARVHLYRAKDR